MGIEKSQTTNGRFSLFHMRCKRFVKIR